MNLYHVQDSDRPMYVVRNDWQEALEAWRKVIREENNMGPDDSCEPDGIHLVADAEDLIADAEDLIDGESDKSDSLFPIRIRMVGSEEYIVVQKPEDIPITRPFCVVNTNYRG